MKDYKAVIPNSNFNVTVSASCIEEAKDMIFRWLSSHRLDMCVEWMRGGMRATRK